MLAKEKTPSGHFQIIVDDTGDGISAEDWEHIFERYYSGAGDHTGAGIGLSYIKDLIDLHKGEIRLTRKSGPGARFIIKLPAPAADQPALPTKPHPIKLELTRREVDHLLNVGRPADTPIPDGASNGKSQRILLVEDNEDMLVFLESLLSERYVILKARNGVEGLQIARNHHVDLILSDVMMPEMDGLTFCEAIKSNFATSHIPVILLTAKTMDEHRIEGYITGADEYINKPFNAQVLTVRIESLLQQRAQLREKFTRDFLLKPSEVNLTSPDEELLNKVVQMMEENIADPDFNVNKMCDMVYLSHMHFIRKIKQLTGKKPIDLLKSFRLKRAKDLLRQNKANVAEVANMVGYDLPNSFSRAFKKEFGLTPTEWVEGLEADQRVD